MTEPKLTQSEVQFAKFLAQVGVSYQRISKKLCGKVSPMGIWYAVNRNRGGHFAGCKATAVDTDSDPPEFERDQRFEIETHGPTSSLNFQGLGSVLSRSDKIKLIKNSCGGSKDIVVRARILDQYLNRDLDPRLKKLVELGSKTVIRLGLEHEPYLPDQLGRLLRKYFKAHYAGKRGREKYLCYKKVIGSCLGYLLQWHASYESRIKPRLKIDQKIVKELSKLVGIPAQRV